MSLPKVFRYSITFEPDRRTERSSTVTQYISASTCDHIFQLDDDETGSLVFGLQTTLDKFGIAEQGVPLNPRRLFVSLGLTNTHWMIDEKDALVSAEIEEVDYVPEGWSMFRLDWTENNFGKLHVHNRVFVYGYDVVEAPFEFENWHRPMPGISYMENAMPHIGINVPFRDVTITKLPLPKHIKTRSGLYLF